MIGGGGGSSDITPPTIDIPFAQVTTGGIIVRWQTNEESDSFVEYGQTASYDAVGFGRINDAVFSHEIVLPLLNFEGGITYHYRVSSRDNAGNLGRSKDQTFIVVQEGEKKILSTAKEEEDSIVNKAIQRSVTSFEDFVRNYSQKITLTKTREDGIDVEEELESFLEGAKEFVPAPILASDKPRVVMSSDSAVISWDTNIDSNSIVDFVEVDNFDENDPKFTYQTGDFDEYVTQHEVTVPNLESDTSYYMRIRSKNKLGAEAVSDKFLVSTGEEEPKVLSFNTLVSETSITVEWNTNILTDSSVSYVPIRGGQKIVSEAKSEGDPNMSLGHAIILDDLDINTLYSLSVGGVTPKGERVSVDVGNKRTSADISPPIISQMKIDQALYPKLNKVQTVVSWVTNEPSIGKVIYWEGKEEPLDPEFKESMETVNRHIITLTNLKPGTVYRLKVESRDRAGQVAVSNTTAILTPKQQESVINLIIKNVEDIFNLGKR
jgi:hypothetical protein